MQSSPTKLVFKNTVDSPHCTCGDTEDTHHFLFVCHQFTDLRRDLLNSVSNICQPNLNVLLCGDISFSFDQNNQIFKAVNEFIIKSKNVLNTLFKLPKRTNIKLQFNNNRI